MKQNILKAVQGLQRDNLTNLLAFIDDEDVDFITEAQYSEEELKARCEKFFSSKDDATLKIVSKDLLQKNEKLHSIIFTKKESAQATKRNTTTKNGESLTPNQSLVMNKIRRMIERNPSGKIRTDSIEIKDKSKFFIGGVLTTLVEKKLILIELDNKKKFVKLP